MVSKIQVESCEDLPQDPSREQPVGLDPHAFCWEWWHAQLLVEQVPGHSSNMRVFDSLHSLKEKCEDLQA
jgi:hypothetical protein